MIDALITGKLTKDTELKTSKNNNQYCQFLLGVHIGEPDNIIVSCIAFGDIAQRIAKLGKGDALAVTGSLKPTEWQDKATGETRHGLSVTVSNTLSPYDIKKKRKAADGGSSQANPQQQGYERLYGNPEPFNDGIGF
ncbi:single-stranded DNA-binding protein [Methyloglobulus sp.]|uniref:single-stranded DNA-binding protein n=1 Tax=Methyloglobulus sp. TaxID=2518622 RepID=UPI003989F105